MNIDEVRADYEKRFFDIPFGNSAFQVENFITKTALTPERAYRAMGLELNKTLNALQECEFSIAREDIDIEELEYKIGLPETSTFDKRRFAIDIQAKKSSRLITKKAYNDALHNVATVYDIAKRYPEYTRDEFEAGELDHFTLRLQRQVHGIEGTVESLAAIGIDVLDDKQKKEIGHLLEIKELPSGD